MAHGGCGKRREEPGRWSKAMGVVDMKTKSKPKPKPKPVSFKNQMRSVERMLRKELPAEVRQAQEKKLEEIKKQREVHTRLAMERKIFLRGRKIKFFERRKIERRIRRLEKPQRSSSGRRQDGQVEYVRFYPKTEMRRSDDDGTLDLSEDNFFLGSSSDEADDKWTDKSAREQCSRASGKAASGMSSDERNQISARALMPPPRPSKNPVHVRTRFGASSSKSSWTQRAKTSSSSSYILSGRRGSSSKDYVKSNTDHRRNLNSCSDGHQTHTGHSNLSSNSGAHKPKRKRRPKKKKQQTRT